MKQVYGVPALLSLFVPGLGQLVKGQPGRAALVWILILAPWIAWIVVPAAFDPDVPGTIMYGSAEIITKTLTNILLSSPVLPFVLLANFVVQIWSVIDAYNKPV